jgi:hypothetical protein
VTAPVCTVTATLSTQDGAALVGAKITAVLDRTETYQGYIVPRRVVATTNSSGIATLSLFRNILGVSGSRYRVTGVDPTTGKRVLDVYAVVPDQPAVALEVAVNLGVSVSPSVLSQLVSDLAQAQADIAALQSRQLPLTATTGDVLVYSSGAWHAQSTIQV